MMNVHIAKSIGIAPLVLGARPPWPTPDRVRGQGT